MPEQEQNNNTLRFAGRDIDIHDFVDLATSKAIDWMDYQQLQGDERTDFINSFNEVLQGIVDKKYTISEFGKIIGLPEEPNYYRESDGTKKDGEGKWFNSRRRGFNPYGNVETYLNGIAKLAKEYKAPEAPNNKHKWERKTTLNQMLGDLVFGEGNQQDPRKNSGQLELWANEMDPFNNGQRATTNRRNFILEKVIKPYQQRLNDGYYDISDEDKEAELNNINELLANQGSDYLLGRMFPYATHYLFKGEKYQTAEQATQKQQQDELNAWLTNTDPNAQAPSFVTDPSQYTEQRNANIERARQTEFDEYTNLGTLASTNILTYKNSKQELNSTDFNRLMSYTPIEIFALGVPNEYKYIYFNNLGAKEINGKRYYPDFKNNDLYIITKNGEESISLQIVDMASIIKSSKTKNKDLYDYLKESYYTHKGYFKKGGVLKASDGMDMPELDPEDETTPKTTTQQLPIYLTGPKQELPSIKGNIPPWYNQNSPYIWQQYNPGTTPEAPASTTAPAQNNKDYSVPKNHNTNPKLKSYKTKSSSDYALDALAWQKGNIADIYNQRVLDKMTSLQAVHKVPLRKEYLMHTSKPIEDAIARNNAQFNQLGADAAAGTSDQGDAFARRLAAAKAGSEANIPLVQKQAEMTMAQADKALENENANFAKLHEVGEANHAADVALYNYNKQQEAEFLSRQGKQRVAQLTEQQKGIAESAQKNAERERNWSIQNDKKVIEAKQKMDAIQKKISELNEQIATVDKETAETLTQERNNYQAQLRTWAFTYQKALETAASNYDMENPEPYGFAWGWPGIAYIPQTPDPTQMRKDGGKMYYAEKEKTKRMYAKMLFDMMKMDMNHMYKQNRDAYKDYRKIFMQQSK